MCTELLSWNRLCVFLVGVNGHVVRERRWPSGLALARVRISPILGLPSSLFTESAPWALFLATVRARAVGAVDAEINYTPGGSPGLSKIFSFQACR